MKRSVLALFLILLVCISSGSQSLDLKLKESKKLSTRSISKTGPPLYFYAMAIINPMLVIEDKKVFFGLTKEISIGKFPYGRVAFEYSYIFRSYNTSHFRFSYNYDIILQAGDFAAFIATPGAGYFTDTKNKGWFLHGSFGVILPLGNFVGFSPYFRYRNTFIKDKTKSDINDVSLGVSLMIYY
ncbi:MAG: hypothetical protein K8I03_03200 [Ignavibacteria bacterium]|nr:hypothetical protein [Ignavibacteria bacterium]